MQYSPKLAYETIALQQKFQLLQLKELLQYLNTNSPFYKRMFQENKVDLNKITTLTDLTHLPTTSKTDIQQYNDHFLCVPKTEIVDYTATSGTLGSPITIALTEKDLNRLAYNEQQSFLTTGAQKTDIFQLMLTLDRQFMAGMAYYSGLRNLGAGIVRTGAGLPQMQWEIHQKLQTTYWVMVPSFALKMIAYAEENNMDYSQTSLNKIVGIGEGVRNHDFSLNALGNKIKEKLPHCQIYNTYASTEMQTAFTECEIGFGGHHQPDLIIVEILDEEGNILPDGSLGEVTITTLGVEGMPLLRYKTGDMSFLMAEKCKCGRYSKRLAPIAGRKQQMIKYKGTSFFPNTLFNVLNQYEWIKEYVVEITNNEINTDELTLYIYAELEPEQLKNLLKPLLKSALRVTPPIECISFNQIQKMQNPVNNRKPIKLIDNRDKTSFS